MPDSTRQQRYKAILATYRDRLHDPVHVAVGRYCLIEQSRSDGSFYITQHDTQEKAGEYHAGQEATEDWAIEELVDLDTGERHDGSYRVEWQRLPDPASGTEPEPVRQVLDHEALDRIAELFRGPSNDRDDEELVHSVGKVLRATGRRTESVNHAPREGR